MSVAPQHPPKRDAQMTRATSWLHRQLTAGFDEVEWSFLLLVLGVDIIVAAVAWYAVSFLMR
jgi:hypothetical protein